MATAARQRVLLVDNAVDEREMYAEYLRAHGYCTLQAATARDGYQMAADLAPSVVVTTVRLPGEEDGLRFTARLKADAVTRDARVIVLTGCVFEADRAAATRAGCDRFLMKPCLPAELETVVSELIEDHRRDAHEPRTHRDPLRAHALDSFPSPTQH
jgi:DNA-binding response OmpR family regulator